MAVNKTDQKTSMRLDLEVGTVGGKPKVSGRSIGYISPAATDQQIYDWGTSIASSLITYPLSALVRVDYATLVNTER